MLWLWLRSVTRLGVSCRLTAVAVRRQGTPALRLPCGARDVGGDDIGLVPVQAAAGRPEQNGYPGRGSQEEAWRHVTLGRVSATIPEREMSSEAATARLLRLAR